MVATNEKPNMAFGRETKPRRILILQGLRSYDGTATKAPIKIEICRRYFKCFASISCWPSSLNKIAEVHLRLLGTNGFHVKAKIERFTAAGWLCRQNLKYQ